MSKIKITRNNVPMTTLLRNVSVRDWFEYCGEVHILMKYVINSNGEEYICYNVASGFMKVIRNGDILVIPVRHVNINYEM